MSAKLRNVLTVFALATTLTITPIHAAGPQPWEALRLESPWQVVSELWSAAVRRVVSWGKDGPAPEDPRILACPEDDPSCSPKPPRVPTGVGSAIDPDGKP